MPSRVIRTSAVTFANANRPGREHAKTANDRIRIQSGVAVGYLRFKPDVPRDEQLVSAILKFRADDDTAWPGSRTITVQLIDDQNVAFRTLTWDNKPGVMAGSTPVALNQDGSDPWWHLTVTDDVAARVGTRCTWQVTTSDPDRRYLRGDRDNRGYPRLELVTEKIPRTPIDLSPDGGAVSVGYPWLSWLGRPESDQVQVQFDETDGDFSTPVYDSGTIDTGKHELDLAAHAGAWVGIADGQTLDWRVRQHLPSGWSNWSAPATISRAAKPVPVITNPGTVSADPSPPVVWTPPAGQTAWQVLVDIDGDMQDNSGKQPGAATSYTPDVGGDDPGTVYRIRVRTWDGLDRVATPGDPTFGHDEVMMTFQPTATVAPLTNAAGVQLDETPAVAWSWSRGVLPDEAAFRHDRKLSRFPGVDSGQAVDWTLRPNTDLTVEASAVVNGEFSAEPLLVRMRTEVTGVWVVDPETGRGFVLAGLDLEVAYGAAVAVHTPHSAAALVYRMTALRGAEGSMSGWLTDWPRRSLADQERDVWWLRRRPRRVLRLIAGDLNIPVTISNPQVVFDAERSFAHRITHRVAFGFAQTTDEIPNGRG